MSSHPDADSFVRQFLRNPQDETARLVFADWLEDTGEPHNAAWAGYIRAKAVAAREEFGSEAWRASDDEAAAFAPDVRATLTIHAGLFLRYPSSLLRLIPGPNVTVRLAGAVIPGPVVEAMPEPVATENQLLPLVAQGSALVVASGPRDWSDLRRIGWTLDKNVLAVRADREDLRAAIVRTYGAYELFDPSVRIPDPAPEPPLIGLEGDRDSWQIGQLFAETFRRGAAGFELEVGPSGCRVYYLPRRARVPDDEVPEPVLHRLFDHLRALPAGPRLDDGSRVSRPVHLPLVGGRWLPTVYSVRLGEDPRRWLRVRVAVDNSEPPAGRRRP